MDVAVCVETTDVVVVVALFVAVLDVALDVYLVLLVVLEVQPATNNEATTRNRTTITAIGLNCICLCKR